MARNASLFGTKAMGSTGLVRRSTSFARDPTLQFAVHLRKTALSSVIHGHPPPAGMFPYPLSD
jgi:hypothetical protein